MINSQFAGFEIFNAGLSSRAETWIFWGNTMNILEMNIPWTVIQVIIIIYIVYTVYLLNYLHFDYNICFEKIDIISS